MSGNTELSGRFALTHATLIVTHTHTYTRSHSLAHTRACTLQIPGDWISFAGVRELLSICGRVGMSDFVGKTHAKTDFLRALH